LEAIATREQEALSLSLCARSICQSITSVHALPEPLACMIPSLASATPSASRWTGGTRPYKQSPASRRRESRAPSLAESEAHRFRSRGCRSRSFQSKIGGEEVLVRAGVEGLLAPDFRRSQVERRMIQIDSVQPAITVPNHQSKRSIMCLDNFTAPIMLIVTVLSH